MNEVLSLVKLSILETTIYEYLKDEGFIPFIDYQDLENLINFDHRQKVSYQDILDILGDNFDLEEIHIKRLNEIAKNVLD